MAAADRALHDAEVRAADLRQIFLKLLRRVLLRLGCIILHDDVVTGSATAEEGVMPGLRGGRGEKQHGCH